MDERYENEKRLNPKKTRMKKWGRLPIHRKQVLFLDQNGLSVDSIFFFILLTAFAGTGIDILITNGISLRFFLSIKRNNFMETT